MAVKFGVTPPSYSRWENGTEPPLATVVKLARFFKVSVDDLLTKTILPADVPPKFGPYRQLPETPPETAGEPEPEYQTALPGILQQLNEISNTVTALALRLELLEAEL